MPETNQAAKPGTSSLGFEAGQQVSVKDLRAVIAPQNTLDPVEEARLRMVGTHVTELLRSDLPPQEASLHESFIHSLGAEAVLEYLPVR